jgi:decaprenylphospho-beta-D-ribofuranose 2-oxidase
MSDEPSKQTPTSLSQAPWATLWGWGRSIRSRARLWRPESTEELHAGLVETKQPLIPRGAGRAYGDAALCRGGIVADTSRLRRVIDFDPKQGLLTTEAGVLLSDVVARFLPQGWFLPVTPGTLQVSIGGAIAADVHGKNHHLDGGFCSHVSEIELATPSGSLTTRPGEPEFAATAGGMGLVGVVAKATVRLIPIETAYVAQETRRFEDLEHLIGYLFDTDKRFRYSVAWVDLSWRGKKFGRGIADQANHALAEDLKADQRASALKPPRSALFRAPELPIGLVNSFTIRAFNEAWYQKAPRQPKERISHFASFFWPLDWVADWNRLYGPNGFVQYQFVLPDGKEEELLRIANLIASSGSPSFLGVLKRFGPSSLGMISFPTAGWTLAVDFPWGKPRLARLLDGLDEMVASAGGRIYLAKDSRMKAHLIPAMYPRISEFRSIKEKLDPDLRLSSDLSRRLALT